MRILALILLFPCCLFSQVREIALNSKWKFRKAEDSEWLSATVPGTVHTDLLANKKIEDPFSPGAEEKLKWIEESDWEYEAELLLNDNLYGRENYELIFEGLDTYAKVYLNDSLVIKADNMFRTWKADVKKFIKFPVNKIRVVFTSAVKQGKALAKALPYTLPEGERIFTRKAQYQYGWDFGPRYVTCGIWKEVKLRIWNEAHVDDVYARIDSLDKKRAVLNFKVALECEKKGNYRIEVSTPDGKDVVSELNTPVVEGRSSYDLPFTLKDPKLWWCNGMGDPALYSFIVKLYKGKKMLEEKNIRVGVRTVELVQRNDPHGANFYFKLNGVPVFMKGANIIPPDVFLPRVKKEKYEALVQSAGDANMNMLRVWGGGVYADDAFYDACDEKGILVWQDLMFACAMYPGDTAFVRNAALECVDQVRRLRGHPSIASWCGNNESDEGWKNWGWQKQFKYSSQDSARIADDYVFFFEHLLLDIVRAHDPEGAKNYVASSPQIGWGHKESLLAGDSHYWGVWWGMEPFEVYNKKVGRFMSEYGFQGMPSLETLQKNCGELPDSACLKAYEKHPKGVQTMNEYMQRDYKMPNNFSDYIYVSQLLQARGLQTAIEAHRRNKPYCMGSLYWQLNDCWPGITWSSIDLNGNWKAAHYTAKKCFANIMLSCVEENDSLKVYIISDRTKTTETTLNYQLMDLSGKPIWKNTKPVSVEANSSKVFFSLSLSDLKKYNKSDIVFACSLAGIGDEVQPVAYHYFVSPKDLKLSKPKISLRWLSNEEIGVASDVLAKNVVLSCNEPVHFEDNFFDLLPGETKVIKVKGTGSKKPLVQIKSLADTY